MADELDIALDKLTLHDVARAAGIRLETTGRDGLGHCLSPFRDEKTPSFYISPRYKGKCGKDFGDGAFYNLWKFAEKLFPQDSKADLAKRLMDLAGVPYGERKRGKRKPTLKKEEIKESFKNAAAAVDQWNANELLPPPGKGEAAPSFVLKRFMDGAANFEDAAALAALHEERGWPDEWMGFPNMSYCPTPWDDTAKEWAFAVCCPVDTSAAAPVDDTVFCGYHQRVFINGKKSWVYVPHLSASKTPSGFCRALLDHYAAKGLKPGDRVIEPMPYVIGDTRRPKLVAVCEGQWDAITLFGALGGFSDGDPPPVCVFGLRGVNGAKHLLSYWGRWMQWLSCEGHAKSLWLLLDNDAAGKRLLKTDFRAKRRSLIEWMQSATGLRSVGSYFEIPSHPEIKDFNDYWKKRRPKIAEMWATVENFNLI